MSNRRRNVSSKTHPWMTTRRKTARLCSESMHLLYVKEWRPSPPSLQRPAHWHVPGSRLGGVKRWLQLTLTTWATSQWHTVHASTLFPSCSQSSYGGKHPVHLVYSLAYLYNIHTGPQWNEQSSDNRQISLFFFIYTLTSLRHTWHDPSQDSVGHTKHFSWEPV